MMRPPALKVRHALNVMLSVSQHATQIAIAIPDLSVKTMVDAIQSLRRHLIPAACTDDASCGSGQICDRFAECLAECGTDSECPDGMGCSENVTVIGLRQVPSALTISHIHVMTTMVTFSGARACLEPLL